jgi:hypothetical protein
MGLSIRAYARHRGVSDTAVHKAIQSGRITPEGDGTIDPDRADRDWARNTENPRSGTKQQTPWIKAPEFNSDGANQSGGGSTSLLQARTVNEVVKAQTNKVRLSRLKGELVDRSQAIAQVFKLARTERDAWLNWPARVSALLAAELGVDAPTLHVALEIAVREHLEELGDMRIRLDEVRDHADMT